MTREEARAHDAADPHAAWRARFALPEGVIYCDGNSLGALPCAVPGVLADAAQRQWGERLIRSWNEGWIDAPQRIGAAIAPLIGAAADEVIACDTTSANLFKAIVAALGEAVRRDPARCVVLSEAGNFPTDLHIAEGAVACVPGARLRVVGRDALGETLGDDTALLLLTQVHYRTGERFDLAGWTRRAHDAGATMLWDLSHSAGAVAVDLGGADADLAVGCGYKYLNGGPGAPAWLYVARRWQARLASPLSGWMGHAAPFAFEDAYRPAAGMTRWLSGTPPILGLAALEAALGVWEGVDRAALWRKGEALWDVLHAATRAAGLVTVTPVDPALRGSHLSLRHPHAYALTQALIARGVIGDFREPDVLRLGITPLYLSYEDVWQAGETLADVVTTEAWRDPRFAVRAAVT